MTSGWTKSAFGHESPPSLNAPGSAVGWLLRTSRDDVAVPKALWRKHPKNNFVW